MELDVFEIEQPRAGAIGHGDAVAARAAWVCRVAIELAQAARELELDVLRIAAVGLEFEDELALTEPLRHLFCVEDRVDATRHMQTHDAEDTRTRRVRTPPNRRALGRIAMRHRVASIIGLPPLGGSWSEWLLMVGAADAGHQVMIAVLMLSSLWNVAYLLSIVGRGFFWPAEAGAEPTKIAESPVLVWLPPAVTAFGCLVLFFYATDIRDFLMPIVEGTQ